VNTACGLNSSSTIRACPLLFSPCPTKPDHVLPHHLHLQALGLPLPCCNTTSAHPLKTSLLTSHLLHTALQEAHLVAKPWTGLFPFAVVFCPLSHQSACLALSRIPCICPQFQYIKAHSPGLVKGRLQVPCFSPTSFPRALLFSLAQLLNAQSCRCTVTCLEAQQITVRRVHVPSCQRSFVRRRASFNCPTIVLHVQRICYLLR
jgi:hypothetical protein